jgi:hypothetical protein
MGKNVKTIDFLGGCNFLKGKTYVFASIPFRNAGVAI